MGCKSSILCVGLLFDVVSFLFEFHVGVLNVMVHFIKLLLSKLLLFVGLHIQDILELFIVAFLVIAIQAGVVVIKLLNDLSKLLIPVTYDDC